MALSLIQAIGITKKRTWSPSLKKKIISLIFKKRRDWDYSRVYSKMRRDFVLLRQQAFFISDHSNTQNQGSGWLKDMGFCLHKQKSKKFSVPMCNRTQKVHLNLPTLSPGSQMTLEGRLRCALSWGYLKGFVFLWLNSGWIWPPFHRGPFNSPGQYGSWQCSNSLC